LQVSAIDRDAKFSPLSEIFSGVSGSGKCGAAAASLNRSGLGIFFRAAGQLHGILAIPIHSRKYINFTRRIRCVRP
jgi:hypothetical protein